MQVDSFARRLSIDLREEPSHIRFQPWHSAIRGHAIVGTESSLTLRGEDDHVPRIWKKQPHDRDTVIQIPSRLFAQHRLFFVFARYLDGEHRRHASHATDPRPDVTGAPYRGMVDVGGVGGWPESDL